MRPALSTYNHKSSVLCPETNHITTQYLALEQLEAHHRMVLNAKGAVDTSAPRSVNSYISNLAKKKKQLWKHERMIFSPSQERVAVLSDRSFHMSTDAPHKADDDEMDENTDNGSTSLNKSIQAGIPLPAYNSKVADKITWYLEAVAQGEFQNLPSKTYRSPAVGGSRLSGSQVSLSSSLRSGRIVKGDLLDWHKKCFTSGQRSFSPRILASNSAKSKLLDMRCYNSHRKQKKSGSLNSSDTFESDEDEGNKSSVDAGDSNDAGSVESDVAEEEEIEEEAAEEGSERNSHNDDTAVSSMREETTSRCNTEEYHKDWLHGQGAGAQPRKRGGTRGTINENSSDFKHSHLLRPHFNYTDPLSVVGRVEEEKCLKFLNDVTEDILRSGVYTDRAIQRAFEFHLQFYSKDGDEEKLRHLLNQVLEGLKLGSDDSEEPLWNLHLPSVNSESAHDVTSPPEKGAVNDVSGLAPHFTTEKSTDETNGIESPAEGTSAQDAEDYDNDDFETESVVNS